MLEVVGEPVGDALLVEGDGGVGYEVFVQGYEGAGARGGRDEGVLGGGCGGPIDDEEEKGAG